ncbi:hypothetical protein DPSP01_006357 [Paraphaeosphaeria sporulosa]
MRNFSAVTFFAFLSSVELVFAAGGGGSGGGGGSSGGSSGGGSRGGSSGGSSSGSSGSGNRGSSSSSGGGSSSSGNRGGSSGGSGLRPGSRPGGGSGSPDEPDDGDSGAGGSSGGDSYYAPLSDGYLPAIEQVQDTFGPLELSFNGTNITSEKPSIEKIVEVILSSPTCTPISSDEGVSVPESVYQACTSKDVGFQPTKTLPASSYAACTDYASILNSCASATPSFYALPASQQISCACYTITTTSVDCSISRASTYDPTYKSSGEQYVSVPTQAIGRFDDAANYCRDYFGQQGYINLASLLSGNGDNKDPVLGAAFCSNVGQRYLQTAATTTQAYYDIPTASNGLPLRLEPTPYGACYTVREIRYTRGAGIRVFSVDTMLLVMALIACIFFS